MVITSSGDPVSLARAARREVPKVVGRAGEACLIEVGLGLEPVSTVIGSKRMAELGSHIASLFPGFGCAVRGRVLVVAIGPEDWLATCEGLIASLPTGTEVWIALAGPDFGVALNDLDRIAHGVRLTGGSRDQSDADVVALAAIEIEAAGLRFMQREEPGPTRSRSGFRRWLATGLGRWFGAFRRTVSDAGQATLLTIGACFGVVAMAMILLSVAGAVTGKGRAQRAADLSALSAARSMRDDLPRLLAPPTLPNGMPNPAHMPKPVYLSRATATAKRVASANGASALTVSVRFPDAVSFAPLRVKIGVPVRLRGEAGPGSEPVRAEARVGIVPTGLGGFGTASGGGYSGPLALRQGHGMRPDVGGAVGQMSAGAPAAGVSLVINSGFRSDAEQARLFAANPDPRWVAPPGRSLHRCATELDIGPPSAYGWLASNAGRFGFTKRYSWEPWHFGFTAGPAPCSAGGERVGSARPRPESSRSRPGSLPVWVPARYRPAILAASLASGVPALLLAAQLRAESNFDPGVVSSAGAQGIAQFMPATAAAYGLRDPFDPFASIAAQARMMSELLARFRSPALALAAYNAGPGAVGSCNCIPPYPETRAYVTRILGLVEGLGSIGFPGTEVELIE